MKTSFYMLLYSVELQKAHGNENRIFDEDQALNCQGRKTVLLPWQQEKLPPSMFILGTCHVHQNSGNFQERCMLSKYHSGKALTLAERAFLNF